MTQLLGYNFKFLPAQYAKTTSAGLPSLHRGLALLDPSTEFLSSEVTPTTQTHRLRDAAHLTYIFRPTGELHFRCLGVELD
jgi:hypothetical protein